VAAALRRTLNGLVRFIKDEMRIKFFNGYSRNRNWVWIDFALGKWWYVFIWRKGGHWPFMYRSTDATPPNYYEPDDGHAQMLWGKYVP
jgi:hypothetical protein